MTDHRHDAVPGDADMHALSGAYAVDALDEIERARFERHLAQCADCRAEVDELRETAALLGLDDATAPPPALKEAVLQRIDAVRPMPPRSGSIDNAHSRRGLRFVSRGLLVAASVVAILMVAGAVVFKPFGGTADGPSAAEQVMAAADAVRVSQEFSSGAKATVVLSRSQGRAVIVTDAMDPAPNGMVYEVWLQTPAGDMVPAGLMPDRPDAVMVLDGDASDAVAAGITIEPDGGSPKPTSEPIALFTLDS